MDKPAFVIVGQIGAPYGVKGWHHVHSFTVPLNNILTYPNWYVEQSGNWLAFKLGDGRAQGKGVVALLQGIKDRNKAAQLTNSFVRVERTVLAPLEKDEFYWADLEGLEVVTLENKNLGKISTLYDNAGTHVMVVSSQNVEQHIPFLMHDTVVSVDFALGKVVINWEPAR